MREVLEKLVFALLFLLASAVIFGDAALPPMSSVKSQAMHCIEVTTPSPNPYAACDAKPPGPERDRCHHLVSFALSVGP